jgi:hypothetical protein
MGFYTIFFFRGFSERKQFITLGQSRPSIFYLFFCSFSVQHKRKEFPGREKLWPFSLFQQKTVTPTRLKTQELAQELLTAIPTLRLYTSPETGNDGTPTTHIWFFTLYYSYNKLNIEIWCRVQGELTDGDGS